MKSIRKALYLMPLVIAAVGSAIWLFMISLEFIVTLFKDFWVYLVVALPLVHLFFSYLPRISTWAWLKESEDVASEIHDPRSPLHHLTAPWVFISTLIYHLLGASVGRESAAILIGASVSDSLGRLIRIPLYLRPVALRMGLASGFAAAFGVPWAGSVFCLEFAFTKRRQDWIYAPLYLGAAWGADLWARRLGLSHELWKSLQVTFWEIGFVNFLTLTFFLVGLSLIYGTALENARKLFRKFPWWMPAALGGAAVFFLTLFFEGPQYNNLGTAWIQSSFEITADLRQALAKIGLTFISIATGMKGGEVTPLMASGALFGSWFAGNIHPAVFQLGAAFGLVTLFCSRLRIPATGIVLLWELFDWRIALLGAPALLLTEYGLKLISKASPDNPDFKAPGPTN